MTARQSQKLKVGIRVCWNGETTDCGTVSATYLRYVTIEWDDGHVSHSGHSGMQRVELAAAKG